MVSFWPWKGDDSSPASFEKALSTLSARISKTSSKLDTLRQRSRRLIGLWTLYAGFVYLLYTVILVLVVGWRAWSLVEYTAIAGGPLIIYVVRLGLFSYYDYRTSNFQRQLNELQKERDATIEKLKEATKYNSTQELLKKYSGTPTSKAKPTEGSNRRVTPKPELASRGSRTPFVPPPTANIPGRDGLPPPHTSPPTSTPQSENFRRQQASRSPANAPTSLPAPYSPSDTSAEFAPNAFSAPPQYAQVKEGSRWYDRIMDVLLGEDETRPAARLALICSQCRLVNGQAPPGVKHLEDLGKWRCGGCGAMNGEDSEVKRIVSSMQRASKETGYGGGERSEKDVSVSNDKEGNDASSPTNEGLESDVTQYSTEKSDEEERGKEVAEITKGHNRPMAEPDALRRRSTRSTKGKKPG